MLIVGHLHGAFRTVELDVDIGSSALDYAALQKSEVSSPYHVHVDTDELEIEAD